MSISSWVKSIQKKGQQKRAQIRSKSHPKIEGTSTTYGQLIFFPSSESPSIKGFSANSAKSSKAVFGSKGAPFMTRTVKIVQEIDELEEAINKFGDISNLECGIKTDVAIAAVSSNKNATVVVSKNKMRPKWKAAEKSPKSFFGPFLNDFSKVTPNVVEYATVVGSSIKSEEEIKTILDEAKKVDFRLSLRSKKSESIEMNILKVPNLEAKFVYNFFVEDEEDVDIQEDQANDPLINNRPVNTPRYVTLVWNTIDVTEPLAGTEKISKKHEEFRKGFFSKTRGMLGHNSTNFRNSIGKRKKKFFPFKQGGIDREIVDMHMIEKGFGFIANQKLFPNSIFTILNIEKQKSFVNNFPFLSIKEM